MSQLDIHHKNLENISSLPLALINEKGIEDIVLHGIYPTTFCDLATCVSDEIRTPIVKKSSRIWDPFLYTHFYS